MIYSLSVLWSSAQFHHSRNNLTRSTHRIFPLHKHHNKKIRVLAKACFRWLPITRRRVERTHAHQTCAPCLSGAYTRQVHLTYANWFPSCLADVFVFLSASLNRQHQHFFLLGAAMKYTGGRLPRKRVPLRAFAALRGTGRNCPLVEPLCRPVVRQGFVLGSLVCGSVCCRKPYGLLLRGTSAFGRHEKR